MQLSFNSVAFQLHHFFVIHSLHSISFNFILFYFTSVSLTVSLSFNLHFISIYFQIISTLIRLCFISFRFIAISSFFHTSRFFYIPFHVIKNFWIANVPVHNRSIHIFLLNRCMNQSRTIFSFITPLPQSICTFRPLIAKTFPKP